MYISILLLLDSQWQRFFNSAYYDGMYALSKVTRYVRDVYEGLQQAPENTEPQNQCPGPKKEVEFEDLGDTSVPSVNGNSSLPEKVPCTLNTNLLYVLFKFYFLLLLSGGIQAEIY